MTTTRKRKPDPRKPSHMTLPEVKAAISNLPEHAQAATVCALIGHSRIVTAFFGYVYCARCEAQIGDALGGAWRGEDYQPVIVGHNCDECHKAAQTLTWRDTFMAPDPGLGRRPRNPRRRS